MIKKALALALPALCLFAAAGLAQSPSPELSPYEELRYGSDLSRVPRDPYRTEYILEGYVARPYIPPEAESSIRPGADGRGRARPAPVSPSPARNHGLKNHEAQVRDRYQTRSAWRNEQRRISERSRIPVPSAPLAPGSPASLGRPGAGQPDWPAGRR